MSKHYLLENASKLLATVIVGDTPQAEIIEEAREWRARYRAHGIKALEAARLSGELDRRNLDYLEAWPAIAPAAPPEPFGPPLLAQLLPLLQTACKQLSTETAALPLNGSTLPHIAKLVDRLNQILLAAQHCVETPPPMPPDLDGRLTESVTELLELKKALLIAMQHRNKRPMVITVSAPTGAGKEHVTSLLRQVFTMIPGGMAGVTILEETPRSMDTEPLGEALQAVAKVDAEAAYSSKEAAIRDWPGPEQQWEAEVTTHTLNLGETVKERHDELQKESRLERGFKPPGELREWHRPPTPEEAREAHVLQLLGPDQFALWRELPPWARVWLEENRVPAVVIAKALADREASQPETKDTLETRCNQVIEALGVTCSSTQFIQLARLLAEFSGRDHAQGARDLE